MSYSEVDVFISNYTLVDPEVYQLWVEGYSCKLILPGFEIIAVQHLFNNGPLSTMVEIKYTRKLFFKVMHYCLPRIPCASRCTASEAVSVLESRGIMQQTNATIDLVDSDVLDHYRTYSLLEKLLQNPIKLAEQVSFQIEPQTQQLLIERYYEFDDSVIRELLGKKLSSRHRKDLDEVSDKTNVLLKSCRRQFDNVKRVFKAVEELPGNMVQNIKTNFLLSDELSKKYGAIVFIACVRFETSKRKLQYLTFPDFYHCATAIMNKWTYRDATPEFDLDREFLLDLREVRILLDKEREHKHLVCQRLKPTLLERSYQELESNFRSYSRAIVGLACNLHRSRELRSLFVELVERCIEPWRQVSWSHIDLKNFLLAYEQCAIEMDVLREVDLKSAWERYMSVVSSCLLRMYHS